MFKLLTTLIGFFLVTVLAFQEPQEMDDLMDTVMQAVQSANERFAQRAPVIDKEIQEGKATLSTEGDEFDKTLVTSYSSEDEILRYFHKQHKLPETKWDAWGDDCGESIGGILVQRQQLDLPENKLSVRVFGDAVLAEAEKIQAKYPFEVHFRLSGPYFLFVLTPEGNKARLLQILKECKA